jgi:DHA2 family multidrug resistance protein
MSHGLTDSGQAWHEAVVAVGRAVRSQAFFLAYGDAFALMGAGLLVALLLSLFLARPASTGGGGGGH